MKRTLGRYQVIGKRAHREHPPGTIFEACLERGAEQRAVARGSIKLLERIPADLPPQYRLPIGWPTFTPKQEGS